MNKLIIWNGQNSIDLYNNEHIVLISAEGLGIETTVNTAEYGALDGGMYINSRLPVRVITATFRVKNALNVSAVKKNLYRIFTAKAKLEINIISGTSNVFTTGYCEKIDIPPNNNPLVGALSIVCPDPYFYTDSKLENVYGTTSAFCFLQGGISLNNVLYGNTGKVNIATVDYDGDEETGVVFKISAFDNISNIRIENLTTGEYISFGVDLKPDDIMTISTVDGDKFIQLTRNDEVYNYLKYLDNGSSFFKLSIGENKIKFTATGITPSSVNVAMTYRVKVGGV